MIITRITTGFVLFSLLISAAGCSDKTPEDTQEGEADMAVQLTSKAFTEGDNIPRRFTCDGTNTSPQLAWTGIPDGSKSLALIMDDPDAPGRTFVHWVLYDLPPDLTELAEGYKGAGVTGANSYRKTSYNGPCPPPGSAHRYYFKLYALDKTLNLSPGSMKDDIERAMQGHILAWGQLMGKYGR